MSKGIVQIPPIVMASLEQSIRLRRETASLVRARVPPVSFADRAHSHFVDALEEVRDNLRQAMNSLGATAVQGSSLCEGRPVCGPAGEAPVARVSDRGYPKTERPRVQEVTIVESAAPVGELHYVVDALRAFLWRSFEMMV